MNDATIPAFEGRPVDGTQVKMSGAAPLDGALDGVVLGMDDMVQMLSMFKVVGVHHKVDDKTGNLIRVQVLKPVELELHPIDANDPNDDGVIRAIPYAVAGPTQANALPSAGNGQTDVQAAAAALGAAADQAAASA